MQYILYDNNFMSIYCTLYIPIRLLNIHTIYEIHSLSLHFSYVLAMPPPPLSTSQMHSLFLFWLLFLVYLLSHFSRFPSHFPLQLPFRFLFIVISCFPPQSPQLPSPISPASLPRLPSFPSLFYVRWNFFLALHSSRREQKDHELLRSYGNGDFIWRKNLRNNISLSQAMKGGEGRILHVVSKSNPSR